MSELPSEQTATKESNSRVRNVIALLTAVLFFGGPLAVLAVRLFGLLSNEDLKNVLEVWASYFGAPAGTVLGYYFGSRQQS